MNYRKSIFTGILTVMLVITAAGCGELTNSNTVSEPDTAAGKPVTRPEGWTEATHGNDAAPDYDIVFPQNTVNRMTITIAPENWETMQDNLIDLFGQQRTGRQDGIQPDAGDIPQGEDIPPGGGGFPQRPGAGGDIPPEPDAGNLPADIPQRGGFVAPGGGLPGARPGGDMTPENPTWVPATIEFNGLTWTNVGVRYKGNSSLRSGWNSRTLKLPLKLDFDEFEDEYPEIDDQRFYGFKQLSLSNGFHDSTFMRDTIAADILEEAGLPAAETAYYDIILDYGEGPVDLGLYVVIEVIDDTVIGRYFGDDSGNIYEGDGAGVSLAQGTFNRIADSFEKENNEDEADWSDIETLYTVLHAAERTTDPEAWRETLESVFDVDTFLEWLAVSAVIQNWDNYGSMSHNFYLYHDPATDQLVWISWDHNDVLGGGGGGGMVAGGGMRREVSLDREDITENWPLIRYLLDDPVYYDRYTGYIAETIAGPFDPEKLETKCRELAELIAPYAEAEVGANNFDTAVTSLINRIADRYQIAADFVGTEG